MRVTRGSHPWAALVQARGPRHVRPRTATVPERRTTMNYLTLPFLGLAQAISAITAPSRREDAAHKRR